MDIQTLRQVAWLGDKWLSGKPKGIVLNFHGMGSPGLRSDPTTTELAWAERGGLVIFPYYGPWSWMKPPGPRPGGRDRRIGPGALRPGRR